MLNQYRLLSNNNYRQMERLSNLVYEHWGSVYGLWPSSSPDFGLFRLITHVDVPPL